LLDRRKVAKHFRITITDNALSFMHDHAAIAAEAALDGFYVLRTSVPAHEAIVAGVVRAKILRQIVPRRTRTQDPKDTIEGAAVVQTRYDARLFR
jgi:hypothetical protein